MQKVLIINVFQVLWGISKNNAIDRLNNSMIEDKGVL